MAVLTVGGGGTYQTLQVAINTAVAGDTIRIIELGNWNDGGTVNGKNLTIEGSTSYYNAPNLTPWVLGSGCLSISNCTVNLRNMKISLFRNNRGGAISATNNATVNIWTCSISGCGTSTAPAAESDALLVVGGGIYGDYTSHINIYDSSLNSNNAYWGGAGCHATYLYASGVDVRGNSLTGAGADGWGSIRTVGSAPMLGGAGIRIGGGAHNFTVGSGLLENCTIAGNVSTWDGGGAFAHSGSLGLIDVRLIGNSAVNGGGGCASSHHESAVDMSGCIVSGNTAYRGGGVHAYKFAQLKLRANTWLINNVSSFNAIDKRPEGGGGGVDYGGRLFCYNSLVRSNSVSNNPPNHFQQLELGGGAFVCKNSGFLEVEGCYISGNTGSNRGATFMLTERWPADQQPYRGTNHVNIINNIILGIPRPDPPVPAHPSYGGAIYTGISTSGIIRNNVFWRGYSQNDGAAIFLGSGIDVSVTNNVFSDSWHTAPHGYVVSAEVSGSIVKYNQFFQTDLHIAPVLTSGGVDLVSNNASGVNLWFVSGYHPDTNFPLPTYFSGGDTDRKQAAGPNFHERSIYGTYSGGTYVYYNQHSPLVDGGNPGDPVYDEPLGNGGRVNAGAYGGTAQASLSSRLLIDLSLNSILQVITDIKKDGKFRDREVYTYRGGLVDDPSSVESDNIYRNVDSLDPATSRHYDRERSALQAFRSREGIIKKTADLVDKVIELEKTFEDQQKDLKICFDPEIRPFLARAVFKLSGEVQNVCITYDIYRRAKRLQRYCGYSKFGRNPAELIFAPQGPEGPLVPDTRAALPKNCRLASEVGLFDNDPTEQSNLYDVRTSDVTADSPSPGLDVSSTVNGSYRIVDGVPVNHLGQRLIPFDAVQDQIQTTSVQESMNGAWWAIKGYFFKFIYKQVKKLEKTPIKGLVRRITRPLRRKIQKWERDIHGYQHKFEVMAEETNTIHEGETISIPEDDFRNTEDDILEETLEPPDDDGGEPITPFTINGTETVHASRLNVRGAKAVINNECCLYAEAILKFVTNWAMHAQRDFGSKVNPNSFLYEDSLSLSKIVLSSSAFNLQDNSVESIDLRKKVAVMSPDDPFGSSLADGVTMIQRAAVSPIPFSYEKSEFISDLKPAGESLTPSFSTTGEETKPDERSVWERYYSDSIEGTIRETGARIDNLLTGSLFDVNFGLDRTLDQNFIVDPAGQPYTYEQLSRLAMGQLPNPWAVKGLDQVPEHWQKFVDKQNDFIGGLLGAVEKGLNEWYNDPLTWCCFIRIASSIGQEDLERGKEILKWLRFALSLMNVTLLRTIKFSGFDIARAIADAVILAAISIMQSIINGIYKDTLGGLSSILDGLVDEADPDAVARCLPFDEIIKSVLGFLARRASDISEDFARNVLDNLNIKLFDQAEDAVQNWVIYLQSQVEDLWDRVDTARLLDRMNKAYALLTAVLLAIEKREICQGDTTEETADQIALTPLTTISSDITTTPTILAVDSLLTRETSLFRQPTEAEIESILRNVGLTEERIALAFGRDPDTGERIIGDIGTGSNTSNTLLSRIAGCTKGLTQEQLSDLQNKMVNWRIFN